MVISYTAPASVKEITQICVEINCKGVFSWQIDDDNGMLLEAMLEGVGKPTSSVARSSKEYMYAPECSSGTTIKEGMTFEVEGTVYKATQDTWSCPSSWSSSFEELGDVDNFITSWPNEGHGPSDHSDTTSDDSSSSSTTVEDKEPCEEDINTNLVSIVSKKTVRRLRGQSKRQ